MIYKYGLPRDRNLLDDVALKLLYIAVALSCTDPKEQEQDVNPDILEIKDNVENIASESHFGIIKMLEKSNLREK
jgi:hypothetical protein